MISNLFCDFMEVSLLKKEIEVLKRQKNVLILAHYYTLPEVQEVADYVGDSLGLSQKAARTDADIILFAGVHFMAETAKILNPNKKVLVPDMAAGCPLADSCDARDLADFMAMHSGYKVISYINCTASVKALSDLIVTSGNALRLVEKFPKDEKIIFAPDRNLGGYINRLTGRKMLLWDGACRVHDRFPVEAVKRALSAHPQALTVAHPECRQEVLELADFVGSTAAMLDFVAKNEHSDFIVITESGILHEMQKRSPEKHFYTLFDGAPAYDCFNMKKNNLENIYSALVNEQPEIQLDADLMKKALLPIERMLEIK